MRRVIVLLALAACAAPPPVQIAPSSGRVALTPAAVVQTAARELTATGFTVTVSDAAAGVLTAARTRGPRENTEYVTCRWPAGSVGDRAAVTVLTLSIAATADGSGSTVAVSSRVRTTYPSQAGSGMMALPESDTDCASSGAAEQRLMAALK